MVRCRWHRPYASGTEPLIPTSPMGFLLLFSSVSFSLCVFILSLCSRHPPFLPFLCIRVFSLSLFSTVIDREPDSRLGPMRLALDCTENSRQRQDKQRIERRWQHDCILRPSGDLCFTTHGRFLTGRGLEYGLGMACISASCTKKTDWENGLHAEEKSEKGLSRRVSDKKGSVPGLVYCFI